MMLVADGPQLHSTERKFWEQPNRILPFLSFCIALSALSSAFAAFTSEVPVPFLLLVHGHFDSMPTWKSRLRLLSRAACVLKFLASTADTNDVKPQKNTAVHRMLKWLDHVPTCSNMSSCLNFPGFELVTLVLVFKLFSNSISTKKLHGGFGFVFCGFATGVQTGQGLHCFGVSEPQKGKPVKTCKTRNVGGVRSKWTSFNPETRMTFYTKRATQSAKTQLESRRRKKKQRRGLFKHVVKNCKDVKKGWIPSGEELKHGRSATSHSSTKTEGPAYLSFFATVTISLEYKSSETNISGTLEHDLL